MQTDLAPTVPTGSGGVLLSSALLRVAAVPSNAVAASLSADTVVPLSAAAIPLCAAAVPLCAAAAVSQSTAARR